jgi:hypothetical protein
MVLNIDHERFCQAAHKRICAGEKLGVACEAAYRETILESGAKSSGTAFAANVRKLRNLPAVRTRLRQLGDQAAQLASIDAAWALLRSRRLVEFDAAAFLEGKADLSDLPGDVEIVEIEDEEGISTRTLHKTKIKAADRIAAMTLMARIAGWLSPENTTTVAVTLEQLIAQSVQSTHSTTGESAAQSTTRRRLDSVRIAAAEVME